MREPVTPAQAPFAALALPDLERWPPWELLGAWEAARDDAREAYAWWNESPPRHRAECFAVYRAAADRETAASVAWMRA
jgi:hypothetical protein